MSRIACIAVADFPVAALVRANPALAGAPLALSATLAPHSELIFVSPGARKSGVYSGMTVAQARSIIPALAVAHRSEAAEVSAMGALADVAESLSPLIEPEGGGRVWLDLAGMGRLYPSEEEIASELVARCARIGLDEVAVGIASNKETACLAARCGGIRVIDRGREAEFLNWLPLDVIGADDSAADIGDTLARWGIRRLGELARLDPGAVGSRLGRRGAELIRLARGGDPAPLVPRRRAQIFTESIELDYAIESLEPLGFVMRPILERLCERLGMRGMVAGAIVLSMGLGARRKFSRRVALGAPSVDARAILALITLSLESLPPESGIESIRIDVEPQNSRAAQADMFLPPCPAPDRLELTIARLSALCGPQNVGTLRAQDSYRSEAVRVEKFDPAPPRAVEPNGSEKQVAQLAVRAIRPALEVEVLMNRGMPEFVRGPNLGARVVSIAGPWRRTGEWWECAARVRENEKAVEFSFCSPLQKGEGFGERSNLHGGPNPPSPFPSWEGGAKQKAGNLTECGRSGFCRDYYEFALDDGGVYRAFRDLDSEKWFVDGVYD